MAKILDGKWLASEYQARLRHLIGAGTAKGAEPPGLGVILVGDNPASQAYVASKEKTAKNCGFVTKDFRLPSTASQAQVRDAIQSLNTDKNISGILLQLPLPSHLDQAPLLDSILPEKDADGLHPYNQGRLMRGDAPVYPCTPLGVMRLIDLAFSSHTPKIAEGEELTNASLKGKKAVIIGRSVLVGKPVSLMLLERDATVCMAHSKTLDLPRICSEADIVVAAVGVAGLVKGEWVKKGAVVIDVGINRLENGQLTGDVDFKTVAERCAAITPVPGGVGPMTVTMLLWNTYLAWMRQLK